MNRSVAGGRSPSSDETVVDEALWARLLTWSGLPFVGAGVGWLLKSVSGWALSLPWIPFQGPFELAERIFAFLGEPQATIGAAVIGAAAGLVLAFVSAHERLVVGVAGDRVSLRRGGDVQEIAARPVSSVFLDGKELVLLGNSGEELARESSDLSPDLLEEAFLGRGFLWLGDGDPYRDEFRLWVEDTPDLPPSANALLRARSRALRRDEGKEDAREMRSELARLGIVVREEKKRQYWRRVPEKDSE